MSLVVETGQIISGAQSYVSASDCTTYHAARGNAAWTGTDAVKEAALLKAAAYLDGHYRGRWKGLKQATYTQPMEWPRYMVDVVLPDTIPQRLKDAQCELALIALAADLAPNVSAGIKRQKLDVIETEYFAGTPAGTTVYTAVNNLLADLLEPLNSCNVMRG